MTCNGAPASESRTFMTKADCERWAKETELAMERGEFVTNQAQKTTFDEVARMYLATVTPTKRSARSEGFRIALLRTRFGAFYLPSIRSVDVAKFRDDRIKEVSAQSVIHELNTLSVIIEHARIDLGVFSGENPVRLVRKPAREKARSRRVSELELEWLYKAADAGQTIGMKEIITLAVETSMRLGELLGLTFDAVDLKRRTVHLADTKNGDSRDVALTAHAVKTIQGMPRNISGRLFGWRRADSFEHTWKRCIERAIRGYIDLCNKDGREPKEGVLADLRFHDLRHEAVSRLFEVGLSPFEVASMSGHKSMQMLKRYTHVEASKLALKLA